MGHRWVFKESSATGRWSTYLCENCGVKPTVHVFEKMDPEKLILGSGFTFSSCEEIQVNKAAKDIHNS